jgi:hypothetical protein
MRRSLISSLFTSKEYLGELIGWRLMHVQVCDPCKGQSQTCVDPCKGQSQTWAAFLATVVVMTTLHLCCSTLNGRVPCVHAQDVSTKVSIFLVCRWFGLNG